MSEEFLRDFEIYTSEEQVYDDLDWMADLDLDSLAGIRL